MTLLKEKLEAAMTEWNKPPHLFAVTNNVTRASFEKARDNPGHTRTELVKMLAKDGFKASSTTSLLSALVRQGQLRVADGKLYAVSSEYVALKHTRAAKKPAKSQPAPRTALITTGFSVENTIKNLTIYQAKELRDALNDLFK